MANEVRRLALAAWVSEMADGELPEIALEGIDLAALTAGDEDPLFVTIEAVAETTSRNRRRYPEDVVQSIIDQVNQKRPDGYAGHLQDEERAFAAPMAETLWLGGVAREIGGVLHGFIKGYVLPAAQARRDYLRRAKAAGKHVSVSIYGKARGFVDQAERVFEVVEFDLESIDWARPGSEGILTSGAWSLTSEQAIDQEPEGGQVMAETLQELLVGVTVGELRQAAPGLVERLVREAQEQAGVNRRLQALGVVREALEVDDESQEALTVAIEALQSNVTAAQEALDAIRAALGMGSEVTAEEVMDAVTEMVKTRREAALAEALVEAVPDEAARQTVTVIAAAEMRARQALGEPVADVVAFVGELTARDDVRNIIGQARTARGQNLSVRMPVANPGRDNRAKFGSRLSQYLA